MIAAIRSEIRKLLSLRSTYIIFGLSLLFVMLMDGVVTGYNHVHLDDTFVNWLITSTLQGTSFILGLIVLLQVTHEYRYNTIAYTLTLARRRTSVFLAKALVSSLAVLIGAVLFVATGVASGLIGLAASGASLPEQSILWGDILPKGSVYVWGAGMYALIIGFLLRNQVGAIVMYLFGTAIVEQLLSLLLKDSSGYLPFRALENSLLTGDIATTFTPEKSMAIVFGWIVAAGATAWLLFMRRDAN
ncbi:ABC transporter permease [Candidatus Saccharibacteria bacterium]|nr:MAG: ABC transporter permease [Candidatus Saccharibacteria bacterium]